MDEREKETSQFSPPAVGGSSLLVVFAVLCLTVFALLSLSTVQADARLADASAETVSAYYAADCQAQEILARLRNGEKPEGVVFEGSELLYASYSCPISDTQELRVRVLLKGAIDADYVILDWKAVSTVERNEDAILNVWDGGDD